MNKIEYDIYCRCIDWFCKNFDVSNLSGTNTVCSCVVFKNGKPLKSAYRVFSINNNNNIDDYLSIANAVERKYKNIYKKNIPDLIVVDGGKGHLNCVYDVLKLYVATKAASLPNARP